MTALDNLRRCPHCKSADIYKVSHGPKGGFGLEWMCFQCGARFNEPWVASAVKPSGEAA